MIFKTLNPFIDSNKSSQKIMEGQGQEALVQRKGTKASEETIDPFAALLKATSEEVSGEAPVVKGSEEELAKLLMKSSAFESEINPEELITKKLNLENVNSKVAQGEEQVLLEASELDLDTSDQKKLLEALGITKNISNPNQKNLKNGNKANLNDSKLQDILSTEQVKLQGQEKQTIETLLNSKEVKANTNETAMKEMTPKELLAAQLMAQNNSGVSKKEINKNNKFNLDIDTTIKNHKNIQKAIAHSAYAKEFATQEQGLIKGPVSSELLENQKLIDQNGVSGIHKPSENVFSFENIAQVDSVDGKATSKTVIDMSQINATSKVELINEVSNYIQRSYVAGQDKLDVIVKHDELGDFKITAHRIDKGGEVALEIHTKQDSGRDFFTQNESNLVKTLENNGIKLSSLKIAHKSELSFTIDSGKSFVQDQAHDGSSSQKNSGEQSRQQSSSGQSSRQGQEKRRDLWQEASQYREQFAS